jgi:gas vesicle protein
MEDNNRLSYFFLGLGLGVAAGVLFAPRAGSETREYIRGKAEEGADYIKRRGEEIRDSATDLYERGRQQMQRQRENLSAAMEAGKQAYRDSMKPQAE